MEKGVCYNYLEKVKEYFIKTFSVLTPFDYIQLRQEIFSFFQDKHIRVSMFLQEKLQSNDGTIKLVIR